jgi:hypothetical protein
MLKLTPAQALSLRLRAQGLVRQAASPKVSVLEVVKDACGLQAQDLPAASLSIRARSRGLAAGDVERARNLERSIVWTWALRGTLHLVAAADLQWLLALLAPRFIAGNKSRHRQLGLDEATLEQGRRVIVDALASQVSLTRGEIGEQLANQGISPAGQRLPHLIAYAALLREICHGPDREGEATYVLVEDWIGALPPMPREEALAELAHRYLATYAPAASRDLAAWSGASLGDARMGFKLVAGETLQVDVDGSQACLLKSQAEWLDETILATEPVVRLLPYFDTYLMGYASRELMVDPFHWKRINRGGGMLHPTLLVDGRLVGVWSKKTRGDALVLTVEPFEDLDDRLLPGLRAEAEDIGRFLGLKLELRITTSS